MTTETGKQYTVRYWANMDRLGKLTGLINGQTIDEMQLLDLMFNCDTIDIMIQQTGLVKGANPFCWIDDNRFKQR